MKNLSMFLAVLLSGFAISANAVIDVASAVSSITGDGVTAVGAIGAATLVLMAIVAVFRWVRKAA